MRSFLWLKTKIASRGPRLGNNEVSNSQENSCASIQISSDDMDWAKLQSDSLRHASEGNWGLYANTLLDKANYLMRTQRFQEALDIYARLLYVDVNGPENTGGCSSGEFPPFNKKSGMVATLVWNQFKACAKSCKLDGEELRLAFLRAAAIEVKDLIPLKPERAWIEICRLTEDQVLPSTKRSAS